MVATRIDASSLFPPPRSVRAPAPDQLGPPVGVTSLSTELGRTVGIDEVQRAVLDALDGATSGRM